MKYSSTEKFSIRKKRPNRNLKNIKSTERKKEVEGIKKSKDFIKIGSQIADKAYINFLDQNNKNIKYLKSLMYERFLRIKRGMEKPKNKQLDMKAILNGFNKRSNEIIEVFESYPAEVAETVIPRPTNKKDHDLRQLELAEKEFAENGYAPFRDTKKDARDISLSWLFANNVLE